MPWWGIRRMDLGCADLHSCRCIWHACHDMQLFCPSYNPNGLVAGMWHFDLGRLNEWQQPEQQEALGTASSYWATRSRHTWHPCLRSRPGSNFREACRCPWAWAWVTDLGAEQSYSTSVVYIDISPKKHTHRQLTHIFQHFYGGMCAAQSDRHERRAKDGVL